MVEFGEQFKSINPATGGVIWQGAADTEADIAIAIENAREAFKSWSKLSFERRVEHVAKFIELLTRERHFIAHAISKEVGKPLWESETEVTTMINKFKISVESYEERTGDRDLGLSVTRHKPIGVMGVLGPYNFPAHVPNGHIIPALLAGNTVVFKASELTPMVAEDVVKLWHQSGLPIGVLNLVQGGAAAGKALIKDAKLDGYLFTGSSRTGIAIHKELAGKPNKMLALEMGGNNPLIVNDIDDLNAAAYLAVQSAFLTSGQRCTCARRLILIEGEESRRFMEVFMKMTSRLKIGSYHQDDIFMGPVISANQALSLLASQKAFVAGGGCALLPMERNYLGEHEDKSLTAFLSPGIVDVTDCKDRADHENFGPLLQVVRVKNMDAAIVEANNTSYGLSAGLISNNAETFERVRNEVKAGLINWNQQLTGASSNAPFGGIGMSGNFRPSAYYAADYCAYPVASMESSELKLPEKISPGVRID